ncbi:allophanate hydrolase subunit 1 [Lutimaribacter marinistellae]|uniref:Allophanate hydrolase subunit 1 n=1 Tax=Lutimaribacter marinistellae TaxID=1820329 RepID=A0ABV7TJC1_9RHOB
MGSEPEKRMVGDGFPVIRSAGLDGMLVTFGDRVSEPANRAAIAFRDQIQAEAIAGVIETSTSLASAYLRFDLSQNTHEAIAARLQEIVAARDWFGVPLPEGRRLWRIPTVYGTELAPQLAETAELAGLDEAEAVRRLSTARVRVLTIGFAPGQPYLGPLEEAFDIPRQQGLTPTVPPGALVLAISQFVLFSNTAPTGWRHVGQTAFRCFRPDATEKFALNPGDEVIFESVTRADYDRVLGRNADGNGGAEVEEISA